MMNIADGLKGISLAWWPTLLRSAPEAEVDVEVDVDDKPYDTLTADLQELFRLVHLDDDGVIDES